MFLLRNGVILTPFHSYIGVRDLLLNNKAPNPLFFTLYSQEYNNSLNL